MDKASYQRMGVFFISESGAISGQSFAAMEMGRLDRERESPVVFCGRPCALSAMIKRNWGIRLKTYRCWRCRTRYGVLFWLVCRY